jgi:hypothetical protein
MCNYVAEREESKSEIVNNLNVTPGQNYLQPNSQFHKQNIGLAMGAAT